MAVEAGAGAGAEAIAGGELTRLVASTSIALVLFSLSIWLFSLFSLLLSPVDEPSVLGLMATLGGALHLGISIGMPVNVLITKERFSHLRQGLPERSRARKPALIAPWLALGPSRWELFPLDALGVLPLGASVPSSLR